MLFSSRQIEDSPSDRKVVSPPPQSSRALTAAKRTILVLGLVSAVFAVGLRRTALRAPVSNATPAVTDEAAGPHHQVQSQAERVKQVTESPVFAEFDVWVAQYAEGKFAGDSNQLTRGQDLARKRHELFKELIKLNPKVALDRAVSAETLSRLPVSINQKLEQPFSAYGDFVVYVVMLHASHHATEDMTGSRIEREVVIAGSRYKAFVYGRRETMTTKMGIPLQGVIVDDVIALDENCLRRIDVMEYGSSAVDLTRIGNATVVAEVGGSLTYFSHKEALEAFVKDQIDWEARIGPVRPSAGSAASPWTLGAKTVLFIRLDFSDRPGEPVGDNGQTLTVSAAQSLMDNQVNPYYVSNSYNQTSLQTIVTPVVRMPRPQSFYFQNFGALFSDAEDAARNAGFDPNNFDLDIFAMSRNTGFPFSGIAEVGSRGSAINGAFDLRVTAHELGHNYGLLHANLWHTNDGSVIGPGSNIEYGNPFDVMGSGGNNTAAHFGAKYKRRLDWLTDANVQTVATDGTYRVFALDSSPAGGIRALKIRKNNSYNYWVEFRQLFTGNPSVFNGAIITWDYLSMNFVESQLLDMTPTAEATDAPLLIGQTFFDSENRIRLTIVGKGNTTPQSLDVQVEFNAGCSFSLGQASQSFSASGGEGSIPVSSSPGGCSPRATSNNSWIHPVIEDAGPVRYMVAANYDSQARTGTLTIAGQTFIVQQAGTTTPCAALPSGLVAWWRGDGDALDQTGVNNGELAPHLSFGSGKIGGGFMGTAAFNSGFVEVPDSSSLDLRQSMTIEGWLRVGSGGGNVIERRRNADFKRSYSVTVLGDRSLFFGVADESSSSVGVFSQPLPLGQFAHFAASLDDATGQMKLYINGSLVGQTTTTQRPFGFSNAKIYVGNIDGITDELSVYNRALSVAEIQSIYHAGIATSGAAGKCLSGSEVNTIQFNSSSYAVNESDNFAAITVTRTGDTSSSATVKYTTADATDVNFNCNPATAAQITGVASRKCDYHIAAGRLRFGAGETSKQIILSIVNDVYTEPSESLAIALSSPIGATLGTPNSATINITDNDNSGQANPIDGTAFYVRMLYVDLLSREPDPAGFAGWVHRIDFCGQPGEPPPPCDRVAVGGDGFLRSAEFFDREFFVIRLYRTALGRILRYDDVADLAFVSGFLTDADLELNKQEVVTEIMARAEFINTYNSLGNSQYVDTLIQTAGVALPAGVRDGWVTALNGSTKTRAQIFRELSERPEVSAKYLNEARVVSCYYGFFTRNPDGAYFNYLQRLDSGEIDLGDLANAFINAAEYRQRFGP